MSSTSSQELAALASGSKEPECKPSRSARSTRSAAASSQSTGRASPATTTCEVLPLNASPQMELLPMSSAEASRAKTSRSLGDVQAWKVQEAAFGPKSPDLIANYDRDSSSWRTSQGCLLALANDQADGLAEYSETWPRAGLMRNGTASRLPLSELHILATGFGFWPTPNKSNGFAPFSMLTMQRKRSGLTRPSGAKMGFDLKWEPRCVPYLADGWINPILPEWLMGFQIGHTDLGPAETLSSHKSRKSSVARS